MPIVTGVAASGAAFVKVSSEFLSVVDIQPGACLIAACLSLRVEKVEPSLELAMSDRLSLGFLLKQRVGKA